MIAQHCCRVAQSRPHSRAQPKLEGTSCSPLLHPLILMVLGPNLRRWAPRNQVGSVSPPHCGFTEGEVRRSAAALSVVMQVSGDACGRRRSREPPGGNHLLPALAARRARARSCGSSAMCQRRGEGPGGTWQLPAPRGRGAARGWGIGAVRVLDLDVIPRTLLVGFGVEPLPIRVALGRLQQQSCSHGG